MQNRKQPGATVKLMLLATIVQQTAVAVAAAAAALPSSQKEEAASPPFLASVTLAGGGGEVIRDALTSVVPWVDLCIILDTGIQDDTLEFARQVAGDKLLVRSLPWPGDFAAARNAALDAATEAGASWALVLDTDERIAADTSDGPAWRQRLAASEADVISVLHSSLTYAKPRLFRLPRRGRFNGPTHEWFALAAGSREAALDKTTVFKELPKDAAAIAAKARRDIDILRRETAAQPSDQRWWYYLGDAFAISGDCTNAVKAWSSCAALLHGWDEEGAWCMYRAAQCHADSQDWDAALAELTRGLTRHPGLPELPWYAGWICYQAGRYEQAKAWSHMAIALGCHKGLCQKRIGFSHPPATYEGPFDVLHWALKQLGHEAEAAAAHEDMQAALAARLPPPVAAA